MINDFLYFRRGICVKRGNMVVDNWKIFGLCRVQWYKRSQSCVFLVRSWAVSGDSGYSIPKGGIQYLHTCLSKVGKKEGKDTFPSFDKWFYSLANYYIVYLPHTQSFRKNATGFVAGRISPHQGETVCRWHDESVTPHTGVRPRFRRFWVCISFPFAASITIKLHWKPRQTQCPHGPLYLVTFCCLCSAITCCAQWPGLQTSASLRSGSPENRITWLCRSTISMKAAGRKNRYLSWPMCWLHGN